MKIAVAGGSGFIGRALTTELVKQGHHVFILTRNPRRKPRLEGVTYVEWLTENGKPEDSLKKIDAFINLAGENLNSGRWTTTKKAMLLASRLDATEEVIRIIQAMETPPEVLINGSAIGFYGTSLQTTFTEGTGKSGDDFLANVVSKWEETAATAPKKVRVVFTRFGMVLDKNEGALKKMLLPFHLFVGGRLGSGSQWMSWVHIDDVVHAIIHCLTTPTLEGPVNVTAPHPVKMTEFCKTLAKVIHRPYWAPVPSFLLKMALGEMSVLVLEGQRVLPEKLEQSNFSFEFPELQAALKNLLN